MNWKLGLLGLMLSVFLVSSTVVSGANIDLLDEDSATIIDYSDCYGVTIDEDYYYTVIVENAIVKKIELNGSENVDYSLSVSSIDLMNFVENYGSFGPMAKIGFLVNKLGLPANLFINFDALERGAEE